MSADTYNRDLAERCEILEDVCADLIEIARNLNEVLERYIDTIDPDENDWTARNWNLRKERLARAYAEVMLKCSTYKVGSNA